MNQLQLLFISHAIFAKNTNGNLIGAKINSSQWIDNQAELLASSLFGEDFRSKEFALFCINGDETQKEKLDDICQAIARIIPFHFMPSSEIVDGRNLRIPSSFVIISDIFDQQLLSKEFTGVEASEYYDNMAKYIFIAVGEDKADLVGIFTFFYNFKIANVVVVTELETSFKLFSYNPFFKRGSFYYYEVDRNSSQEKIFPDKFKNLKGFSYNVFFFSSPPRMVVVNGMGRSIDLVFIRTVAKKQNAEVNAKVMTKSQKRSVSNLLSNEGPADIIANTAIHFVSNQYRFIKSVNTYETDGFCAIIPFAEKRSFLSSLLDPFDFWTWILILASLISCTIVWKLLNKYSRVRSNTASHFIFGYLAYFLGQSIPFRAHRTMQRTILQLTIFMTLILGNAYQSLIIASMTKLKEAKKLKTIGDLINSSSYNFYVSKEFIYQLNNSEYYQQLSSRIIGHLTNENRNFSKLSSEKVAIIEACSSIDFMLENNWFNQYNKNDQPRQFYYKLQESFNTFYLKIPTNFITFFEQHFNHQSLRVFESGIKQHWKQNSLQKFTPSNRLNTASAFLLNLNELSLVFYLLLFGLMLSSIVFIVEKLLNFPRSNLKNCFRKRNLKK